MAVVEKTEKRIDQDQGIAKYEATRFFKLQDDKKVEWNYRTLLQCREHKKVDLMYGYKFDVDDKVGDDMFYRIFVVCTENYLRLQRRYCYSPNGISAKMDQ